MATEADIVRQPRPGILNPVPYSSTYELYNDTSDSRARTNLRHGIRVTVAIPPQLDAFRYPNMTNANASRTGGGSPVLGSDGRKKLQERQRWLKAAERIRQRSPEQAERFLRNRSSRFEITDFITGLSWSSSEDNGFVELTIELDNTKGLFNYLPPAAKITVWRRKSIRNNKLWYDGGKWYPYMVTYVMDKNRSADGRNHTMSVVCQDRAGFLSENDASKKVYKKGKRRPNGWSPREITIDICKREGIPFNPDRIPSSINGIPFPRLTDFEVADGKIASVISDAWNRSVNKMKRQNQRPFVIHMRTGELEVEFIQPPGKLTVLDRKQREDIIIMIDDYAITESGSLNERLEDEVHTVLKVTASYRVSDGTNKKGRPIKKKKKITRTFTASDPLVLEAYGKSKKEMKLKKRVFGSREEFLQWGQAEVDKLSRPVLTFKVKAKVPLGLWPRRYVWVSSRHFGIRGHFSIKDINYNISQGRLTADITLDVQWKHFVRGREYYVKYPEAKKDPKWY